MGKNRTIKVIADLIAGMIAHRILVKYTNRPESIHHMESEIDNYRETISNFIGEFNWNIDDKRNIIKQAKKSLESELKKPHFNDVKFPKEKKEKIADEVIKEIFR